jgi:hypothetical protein
MAQKIVTSLIDDIDGTVLDDGKGETVTFGYKGKTYEIDLSAKNAKKLEDALKPFISAGRVVKAGGTGATVTRLRSVGPTAKAELQALRDWARANGHTIAERGRVSKEIRDAYHASR